jgi:hypothetical protein
MFIRPQTRTTVVVAVSAGAHEPLPPVLPVADFFLKCFAHLI